MSLDIGRSVRFGRKVFRNRSAIRVMLDGEVRGLCLA